VTAAVAIEDVSVALAGKAILDHVTLSVGPGEILGVLGPSGSGKTTLLRVVLGLLAPNAGRVSLDGVVASSGGRVVLAPERRDLGVVFQDLALWPHLTVAGNLAFGLAARGIRRAERHERVAAMLDRVGLAGFGPQRPGELSGGERQRVAIARALVVEPRAVLFDEPLANLDPVRRVELLGVFRALLQDRGTPAVYVTHDVGEVAGLADRLAVLEGGRIVQEGTLDELCGEPATPFVRAIFEQEGIS
jgi:ABC-type Fe3+/spermidine/putrescine transport system ATPase subunit